MRIFPKKKRKNLLISLAFLIILPLAFYFGTKNIQDGAGGQNLDALIASLRRGCVHCYSVEGRYPPDLEYLCATYGLYYDESQYMVHYTMNASNLMPDITVIELGEGVVE